MQRDDIDVSIILPVHNADKWLEECLQSVMQQTTHFHGNIELSAFNDSSTDSSLALLESWKPKLEEAGIQVVLGSGVAKQPGGVGFAKNKAIEQSHGKYLCFQDADDVMGEKRIKLQYQAVQDHPNSIIGCRFTRKPVASTQRYTRWCNSLTEEQLLTQVYTSNGPTVIMPTWFYSRDIFNRIGGFHEGGKGVPEDLLYFFEHLHHGGGIHRVDESLLMYRYHPEAMTHSIHCDTIWDVRVAKIQEKVIVKWSSFTIWNAGKQGRKFYRALTQENKKKVKAFCDVDDKKISKGYYTFEESVETPKPKVPIVHFTAAAKPFIICVKLDLTGGNFEANLASLNLEEGLDYYHFN
ncbi:queuosine-tRNA galactosyltransferase-like [Glandiceps talaboti]